MSFRRPCLGAPLLAVVVGGAACTPFKIDPSVDADAPDSTAIHDPTATRDHSDAEALDSTAMLDASDGGALCDHRAPPARPSVVDAGGSLDFVLATSDSTNEGLDDAGKESYRVVGFDLDDTCTGEGQDASCVEPPWATHDHTDGVDGIDNAWGQITAYSVHVQGGGPVGLIRVSSYTGQRDDDQVDVSLYVGVGLAPRDDAGDGDAGDGGSPLWDGNDRWNILPEVLASSASPSVDEPLFRDVNAYVSGGILVAHFEKALWSSGYAAQPTLLFSVNEVVLAGLLTQVGGQWALKDATMGFRLSLNAWLMAEGQVLLTPGQIACQNRTYYLQLLAGYCPYLDIASTQSPPSAACDAVSVAALFQAKQALFGDVRPPSPPPVACLSGFNPATDTCELLSGD